MRCCSSVLWAAIVAAATMDAAAAELTDAPVVLFIGNSYTQQNDLAGMVQVSVQARPGESLMARSSTMDGAQLEQVWGLRTTEHLVSETRWTHLVLQEQSTLPLTAPQRMQRCIGAIAAAVSDRGIRVVLLATWPRRDRPRRIRTTSTPPTHRLPRGPARKWCPPDAPGSLLRGPIPAWRCTHAMAPSIEAGDVCRCVCDLPGAHAAADAASAAARAGRQRHACSDRPSGSRPGGRGALD
jgi:hypothetical protein